jgi:NifB/MoaA-like Fe-S oxidoreductase
MDQDYKVLAQSTPLAATNTEIYITPAVTQTVISTLVVTNRSTSDAGTYRVAVVPATEELNTEHYVAFDVGIEARDAALLTIGITLGPLDKIVILASSDNFTFSLFGVEFS